MSSRLERGKVPPTAEPGAGIAGSNGKALASLGATALEYQAPFGGSHARSESMGPLARQVTGLKSAFHWYRAPVWIAPKAAQGRGF